MKFQNPALALLITGALFLALAVVLRALVGPTEDRDISDDLFD